MPVRARAFERRVVSAARDDQSVLHVLHARTIAAGNPVPLICDTNFDPRSPARLPHDHRASYRFTCPMTYARQVPRSASNRTPQ